MFKFIADEYTIKVDEIWEPLIEQYPIWKTRIHRCKQRDTLLVFPEGYRYLSLHKKIYPGSGKVYSIQHINKDMTDFRSENILIKPYKQSYRQRNDIYVSEMIYVEKSDAIIESTEDTYRDLSAGICSIYRYSTHYWHCLSAAGDRFWNGWKCVDCENLRLLKEYGVVKGGNNC